MVFPTLSRRLASVEMVTTGFSVFYDCASNLWSAAIPRRFGFAIERPYLSIGEIFVASYQIKSGAGSPQSKVRLSPDKIKPNIQYPTRNIQLMK